MSVWCWPSVCDAGPTLGRHCVDVWYLLRSSMKHGPVSVSAWPPRISHNTLMYRVMDQPILSASWPPVLFYCIFYFSLRGSINLKQFLSFHSIARCTVELAIQPTVLNLSYTHIFISWYWIWGTGRVRMSPYSQWPTIKMIKHMDHSGDQSLGSLSLCQPAYPPDQTTVCWPHGKYHRYDSHIIHKSTLDDIPLPLFSLPQNCKNVISRDKSVIFFSAIIELVWELVISNMHNKFQQDTWTTLQVIVPTRKYWSWHRRHITSIAISANTKHLPLYNVGSPSSTWVQSCITVIQMFCAYWDS